MSDIDYIFNEALKMKDDEAIDYIFEQLDDYADDEIIGMWSDYLCNNRVRKMQVGGGISSTLGWAKNKGYGVVVENPYE